MNYELNTTQEAKKASVIDAVKKLWPIMRSEKKNLILAFCAIIVSSALTLLSPYLIGHAIDKYIVTKQYHGVLVYSGILIAVYLGAFVASYLQTTLMGGVGQRTLFNLRNTIFKKLQELPVAFFNQNKAGDLISRINNDTDKLNQFFSQALVQFAANTFIIIGAGIFLLSINIKLGLAALVPALFILVFTKLIGGWISRVNAVSLKATGLLSAEVQESLNNFKVVVAFDRRDYFREKFAGANTDNFKTSVSAGYANNIYTPVYGFSSNVAQLIVLAFGIYLISTGSFTVGLLISYLAYVNRFYDPLRQIASIWATLQVALASWDRIAAILALETNIKMEPEAKAVSNTNAVLEFKNVKFSYGNPNPEDGTGAKEVLHNANFSLERGKTYALVGPTGGGKTTTASLMARLYDPTEGTIFLDGRDIRGFDADERAKKIGFILQEPFLFTGTVRDNIVYGNETYKNATSAEVLEVLKKTGLEGLLERFEDGLDTKVSSSGESISLGQRQLVAFIRAALREPELLILDEATANVDTVTEKLLSEILEKLPKSTTRVVIAHRLNTIENADEIFFVNGGEITPAGSLDHAVDLLMNQKRDS